MSSIYAIYFSGVHEDDYTVQQTVYSTRLAAEKELYSMLENSKNEGSGEIALGYVEEFFLSDENV